MPFVKLVSPFDAIDARCTADTSHAGADHALSFPLQQRYEGLVRMIRVWRRATSSVPSDPLQPAVTWPDTDTERDAAIIDDVVDPEDDVLDPPVGESIPIYLSHQISAILEDKGDESDCGSEDD